MPNTHEEGLRRVRESSPWGTEFAYISQTFRESSEKLNFVSAADATDVEYLDVTDCGVVEVGKQFSRRPYALAVQQGSPLMELLNTA